MRFVLFFALLLPSLSIAGPRTVIPDVTEIDFGTVDVRAEVQRPDGVVVTEPKRPKFNPLIRLRADFDREITDSVSEVR